MASFADESDLLRALDALAAAGRYQEVLERLAALPAAATADRTPIALRAAEAHGRLGALVEAERWATLALESARARGERHAEQGTFFAPRGAIDGGRRRERRRAGPG